MARVRRGELNGFELGCLTLTARAREILELLGAGNPPCRVADAVGVSRSAVTYWIEKLEKHGYIRLQTRDVYKFFALTYLGSRVLTGSEEARRTIVLEDYPIKYYINYGYARILSEIPIHKNLMRNFITSIGCFIYDSTEGFGKMRLKAITGIALTLFLLGMLTSAFNVQPAGADVAVDWWPMFRHDLSNTGYSTSTAPNTNHTIWNYDTGVFSFVHSSPAVTGGKVYVGSNDDKVYCLDATTGAQVWNYTTGAEVWSSPAVTGGKVYVGSGDGKVYAFGTSVWSADSAGSSQATFNLTDNVYVSGEGFTADTDITVYLIPDGAEALPANAVAHASATTSSTGHLPVTLVWSQPPTLGEYDIWVDVDQNGVCDGADVWSSQSIGIYGFDVIPEFPTWTSILLILIMLTVAIAIYKRRLLKTPTH